MTVKDDDEAAKAVQKSPFRISLEYIESQVEDEVRLQVPEDGMEHITVLLLRFKNGFVVIGKSAPADPANYNAELGYRFAREDAIRQAWPLFAFALRNELTDISITNDVRGVT
jgi:Phage protein (N4 Gp49/phage Sf6 gene 66) family